MIGYSCKFNLTYRVEIQLHFCQMKSFDFEKPYIAATMYSQLKWYATFFDDILDKLQLNHLCSNTTFISQEIFIMNSIGNRILRGSRENECLTALSHKLPCITLAFSKCEKINRDSFKRTLGSEPGFNLVTIKVLSHIYWHMDIHTKLDLFWSKTK